MTLVSERLVGVIGRITPITSRSSENLANEIIPIQTDVSISLVGADTDDDNNDDNNGEINDTD